MKELKLGAIKKKKRDEKGIKAYWRRKEDIDEEEKLKLIYHKRKVFKCIKLNE